MLSCCGMPCGQTLICGSIMEKTSGRVKSPVVKVNILHARGFIVRDYLPHLAQIEQAIASFNELGYKVGKGRRNMVRHIELDGLQLNVKSFKVPWLLQAFIYRYLRPSKARRSFYHASYLLARDIGTPEPIAYLEEIILPGLRNSYYISQHVKEDLTFRTLIEQPDYPDRDRIVRLFVRFTYMLHREGILFLDHSPGNTLITKEGNDYVFYLVDLNRMRLHRPLSLEERMKNFARLSATEDIIEIMSEEYSLLSGCDRQYAQDRITYHTLQNAQRRIRKKNIHRKLGKYR